jgi:hypothetical protein
MLYALHRLCGDIYYNDYYNENENSRDTKSAIVCIDVLHSSVENLIDDLEYLINLTIS